MPLYEYVCETDGEVIEAIRPMADADKPIADPKGTGRVFKRKLSAFSTGAARPDAPLPQAYCPCGKPGGGCGMR